MFVVGGDLMADLGSARVPYRLDQPSTDSSSEQVTASVARRLLGRLERHEQLLDQLPRDTPELKELTELARRMRRDADCLAALSGEPPRVGTGNRRLADLLAEASALAEESWRILVRPATAATVSPTAAAEFVLLTAEVLDHVTAAYPDAGVDLASYVEPHGGLTVEVSVSGVGRYLPDAPDTVRAAMGALAHVRRSRGGLAVSLPDGAPPSGGGGVVASVSAPASAISREEPVWSSAALPMPGTNGHTVPPSFSSAGSAGAGSAVSSAEPIDLLFGPLMDLPYDAADDPAGTPIFEAIASAWFQERNNAAATDWVTPSDDEWRAGGVAPVEEPPITTASGLPRRRPGNQMAAPLAAPRQSPEVIAERVPDRVRSRLSTYQRGLHQGRHRAPGPDTAI
jgi:hypothetical protein